MGLFSFLKKAGTRIFGKSNADKAEDAAALKVERERQLRAVVEDHGIAIDNLDVKLNDDTVVVYGQTENQENKEKVILAIGNVEGIATVDDRISVVTPEPEAQFYEVKSGDSLSKIAKQFYGDAMKYPVIFEANKPMLKDPNLIYPGQMLRIPPLES